MDAIDKKIADKSDDYLKGYVDGAEETLDSIIEYLKTYKPAVDLLRVKIAERGNV